MSQELRVWPITGRYRVKRYPTGSYGPDGRVYRRWAVIGPLGQHIGSSPTWPEAIAAAQYLARHPELRW